MGEVEHMNKTKFLVTLLAAALTAFVLVRLEGAVRKNTSNTAPAVRALQIPRGLLWSRRGSREPTECKFSPIISPALELVSMEASDLASGVLRATARA